MTFDSNDAQVIAHFGPQKIFQRNNLLILECKSNLSQGGVTVRKDAYDWLYAQRDDYDCGVSLTNMLTFWDMERSDLL